MAKILQITSANPGVWIARFACTGHSESRGIQRGPTHAIDYNTIGSVELIHNWALLEEDGEIYVDALVQDDARYSVFHEVTQGDSHTAGFVTANTAAEALTRAADSYIHGGVSVGATYGSKDEEH